MDKDIEAIVEDKFWNPYVYASVDEECIFKAYVSELNYKNNIYTMTPLFWGVVRMQVYKPWINYLIVRRKVEDKYRVYIVNKEWEMKKIKIWYPTYEEIFWLLRRGDSKCQKKVVDIMRKIQNELGASKEADVKRIVIEVLGDKMPFRVEYLKYGCITCPDEVLFDLKHLSRVINHSNTVITHIKYTTTITAKNKNPEY